jgi:hypothetical protein
MGLSNEERIEGLYYAVDRMVQYGDYLKEKRHYSSYHDKLRGFIDQLWHALIGKGSNGLHWIMGSSASNEVTWDTLSSWGIAINHHCGDVLKKESDFLDYRLKDPDPKFFDAFDGFLNISGLLSQVKLSYGYIYEIFSWTEQATYYLRRYEDELSRSLEGFSKIISDIQGECFRLFKEDNVYANAYVLSAICKKIYGDMYPHGREKWDVVTTFLAENCGHHDMSRMMEFGEQDLKILAQLHVKLVEAEKGKKLTKMMRLEAFLLLAGRRFQYDFKFKKLSEMLKIDGFKKADIAKLHKVFLQNKKAHEEYDAASKQEIDQNRMSPLSIYGSDYM